MKSLVLIIFPNMESWKKVIPNTHITHSLKGDAQDVEFMKKAVADCDILVAAAALIGGISYFHELAYDLIAQNERITAFSF